MTCFHKNFQATVDVSRISTNGGEDDKPDTFAADVRIKCGDCGEPFKFLGLRSGLDLAGARVSVDGMEARLAIWPANEEIRPLPPGPRGFEFRKL